MNTPEETHDPNSPAPPGDDQIRAEIQPSLHSRRPKLPSLEIPSRTPHSLSSSNTPNSSKIGLPPRPSSAKIASKPPGRNPRKNLTPESEKTGLLLSSPPLMESSREKASTSRSFSLTRVFSYSMGKGIHSMPATPASGSSHGHVIDISVLEPKEAKKPIIRSLSVPGTTKAGSLNRMNSMGGRFRVVHANPSPNTADSSSLDESDTKKPEEEGEDIPEEEAVCRICFIELAEGGETLKMECSCRGELALAHKDCAVKWFSIKGNKTCEVCKQEVKNLPVTLLRIESRVNGLQLESRQPEETTQSRFWQDVPILAMVSMLAYFCFLEQLFVTDLGSRALAVSLPFSLVLGFLSSAIAFTIATRSYVWAYASFQFALVILFSYVYYDMLRMVPVLSIILSSITAFGIAISLNSLTMEVLRWRERIRSAAVNRGSEADRDGQPGQG